MTTVNIRALCSYAVCGIFIVVLDAILLIVLMLSVNMLNVVMLSGTASTNIDSHSRYNEYSENDRPGNTKGGSITILLTSCLTGVE
jgi:hypothetical protein